MSKEDDVTSLAESSSSKACSEESPVVTAVLKVMGGSFAVRQDRPELVARLLTARGDVNAQIPISALARRDGAAAHSVPPEAAKQQCPLLHLAALAGLPETFRDLWQNGAETTWRDNVGWTLLHACASGGNVSVTQLCLESIVTEVDICDTDNDTPLHVAAFAGRDAVAQLLLEKKADATRIDADKCSPLHCACRSGIWPLVERLLDAKADPSAVDGHGGTPLAYAVLSHADSIEDKGLSLLRAAGARVCDASMVVAKRQLTSKPACERCIAVDKELTRMKEMDVQDEAEQAAESAAKMLLDEEKGEGSKATKPTKSKKNKKQPQAPARMVSSSIDSIATSTTRMVSSSIDSTTASTARMVSSSFDSTTSADMGIVASMDKAAGQHDHSSLTNKNLFVEIVAAPDTDHQEQAQAPLENELHVPVDVLASTEPFEQGLEVTETSALSDVLLVDATKLFLSSIFYRVLEKLHAARNEAPCVQAASPKKAPIAKKGSIASRRANGELFDRIPLQRDKKREKRQRVRERRQVLRLSCEDACCKADSIKERDAISQCLRADAPEFLPPDAVNANHPEGFERLLPEFVMDIPWGYEMCNFQGPEDANDIATGDAPMDPACFDAIFANMGSAGFDDSYCYGYNYIPALPAGFALLPAYPVEYESEGFGDSDYDVDMENQLEPNVDSISDDDRCLAQIVVHLVVQRVLRRKSIQWESSVELDVGLTCMPGEQYFSTKPVVAQTRPLAVGGGVTASIAVGEDDDAPDCALACDPLQTSAHRSGGGIGCEVNEDQYTELFMRRCGGFELSVIDGSDQLVALPR